MDKLVPKDKKPEDMQIFMPLSLGIHMHGDKIDYSIMVTDGEGEEPPLKWFQFPFLQMFNEEEVERIILVALKYRV